MIIQHNEAAMFSKREFNKNNGRLSRSLEKLSTGYAINRAGDNAAGLAVSEKMRSQIAGIKQSSYNCDDAVSMIQTFEGALKAAQVLVQRCRQLAAQCANGTNQDETDREAMQLEYEQLCEEMDQIANTEFNGVTMLNGGTATSRIYYSSEIVPCITEITSPAMDENGNPVLEPSNYRVNADFISSPPFSSSGLFSPSFINGNGSSVYTTYNGGSTSKIDLSLSGTVTLPDGSDQSYSFSGSLASSGNAHIQSFSDSTGNGYICTKTYSIDISQMTNPDPGDSSYSDTIKVNFIQKAVQRETYLQDGNGNILSDDLGNVVTGKFWDISYEIAAADDCSANYKLNSADLSFFTDTVFSLRSGGDADERYYTPDTNDGPLTNEKVYTSDNMISGFSSYYYSLDDRNFNDLSQKISFPSNSLPDEVRLGNYRNRFNIHDDPIYGMSENGSVDLAYVTKYLNRSANNDGKIIFKGESKGIANSFSDTNITPKLETTYKEVTTAHYVSSNNFIIQAGARGKDSVNFVFSYSCSGLGDLNADLNCTAKSLGMDRLSLKTQEESNIAIDKLDNALNKLSMIRSNFGAVQNRLEHKVDNLNNSNENLNSAESRIRDTDAAKEITSLTKAQIISQSSQAMLAQANSLPQNVMQILQADT